MTKKSKFTEQEINKIKQLRRQGYSGSQIAKIIHRRKKDVLAQIRKIEHKKKRPVTNPYGRKGKPKPSVIPQIPAREVSVYGFMRPETEDHDTYVDVSFEGYVRLTEDRDSYMQKIFKEVEEMGYTLYRYPKQTRDRVDIADRDTYAPANKVMTEKQFLREFSKYLLGLPRKKFVPKNKNKKKRGVVETSKEEREEFKKFYEEGW